jgi:hypothetical protein
MQRPDGINIYLDSQPEDLCILRGVVPLFAADDKGKDTEIPNDLEKIHHRHIETMNLASLYPCRDGKWNIAFNGDIAQG